MIGFFDDDDTNFRGQTYREYFSYYPELQYTATLNHLMALGEVTLVDSGTSDEGWWIRVKFHGLEFVLDTHYHGTATTFLVAEEGQDEILMLAFLGCLLPVIREGWKPPSTSNGRNWIARWFARLLGR